MRIQDLAIIFVIIILPISIVLGAYTQMQISTISLQTEYDMKLTAATSDAIKAFQINTANSTTSDIANSKIRDIEASVSTFKASVKSVFGMNGYSEDEMNEYIPALVYTMYDGFYIYSRFNNQNYLYETEENKNKEKMYVLYETQVINGEKVYGNVTAKVLVKDYDSNPSAYASRGERRPLDKNGENIFGLKPYITYSAEYVKNNIDVVITYSLDNHISIKGMVNGTYLDDSGYLIDGITNVTDNSIQYNGVTIKKGVVLSEYLPISDSGEDQYYQYVRYNGIKYYWDNKNGHDRIIYFLNGNLMELKDNGSDTSGYAIYKNMIVNSDSAYNFYKEAFIFTERVKLLGLDILTYGDAKDYVIIDGKDYKSQKENPTEEGGTEKINVWKENTTKIFNFNTDNTHPEQNIECEKSTFNQHRLAVIKNKIRTNLAIAISNFNSGNSIEFQMPELSEEEWGKVMKNITMISFVQGIDIGGKTYNGYTIVNNSESKEVVREENIYILGKDNFYHRIGDKYLLEPNNIGAGKNEYNYSVEAAGRINLDYNRQILYKTDGGTKYYYPLKDFFASYYSIVSQNYWDENYDKIDDIYAYIAQSNVNLKQAFYAALGRERYGMYKTN